MRTRGRSSAAQTSAGSRFLAEKGKTGWEQKLQFDEAVRNWVNGATFEGGQPKTDPVSGKTYWEHDVFYDTRNEPDTISPEFWRLVHVFRTSSALSDCTRGFAERGTYAARVGLHPPEIEVLSAGTLAPEVTRCLDARLRQAVAPALQETRTGTFPGAVAYVELVSPPADARPRPTPPPARPG
ncbi:MAG: hypothetical protein QM704_27510 [Anaeromyxobacteraceae bacterium]